MKIVTPMMLTPLIDDEKQLDKTVVLMMPTEAALVEHGRRDDVALMELAKFFLSQHPQHQELLNAVHRQQDALFGEGAKVVWFLSAFGLEEGEKIVLYVGNEQDKPGLAAVNEMVADYMKRAEIRPVGGSVEPLVFTL